MKKLNYNNKFKWYIENQPLKNNTLYLTLGIDNINFNNCPVQELLSVNLKNGKINKQEITFNVLTKVQTGEPYILEYEKMALVADFVYPLLVTFDYKVVFLVNNLFYKYYPVNKKFKDMNIPKLIDDDTENYVQKIYDGYLTVNNQIFVSYAPLEEIRNYSIENLYEIGDRDFEYEDFIEAKPKKNTLEISLGSIEEEYIVALIAILNNKNKSILLTTASSELLSYHEQLIKVLIKEGYSICLQPKEIIVEEKDYSDFEKILKRKNKKYKFKHINFYQNPGESLKTVSISQGMIIDGIVSNAINALHEESFNDVFVTAPTGSGKSVLFQIPAIYLAEKYNLLTIVVSPLIGLMSDQVENIKSMTNDAATLNSEYTPNEKDEIKRKIKNGEISILYLSPETLLSNGDIKNIIGERKIGLLVIDESHIVSTWGKSFRPDYWFLGDYINSLRTKYGYNFPIATFSATVTYGGDDDMHGDIVDSLRMRPGKYDYIAPMRRDDISFDIQLHNKENDYTKEKEIAVENSLNSLIYDDLKTIAYFPFTRQINTFHKKIGVHNTGRYFGKLLKEEKAKTAEDFKNGKIPIMLATKAFGMGIDIDDVDVVYHFAPTGNLCDYVQEIGRAARKPNVQGIAKLDYFEEDFRYIKQLHGMSAIRNYHIVETLKKIKNIYNDVKKRNFTISSSLFSYIFPNSSDDEIDAKLKTVLLMIQKDFEKDDLLNFKPLIFKPKSMFTRGYVMIKDSDIEEFKSSEYFKYFNLYQTKDDMATYVKDIDESAYYDKYTNEIKTKESVFDTKITYQGDIYTIDYKKMWEDNFEQLSFGQFKRAFFNGELKGFEIAHLCLPEHLLSISTLERKGKKIKFGEVIEKSEKILKAIEDGISEYAYETKKLKISDIATIIKNANVIDLDEIEYVIAAENYIKIMNMFNNVNGFNSGRVFIHNSISDTYTIVSYNGIKNKTRKIIKHIKSIFVAVKNGDRRLILLHDDNKNIVDQNDMAVAQLLEIFRLTNYEVISGEKPEYFVRINSISAIERILENKYYQSSMVSLVAKRHADSIEKMKHFFVELDNDKDRWDYIEQYFVGEI